MTRRVVEKLCTKRVCVAFLAPARIEKKRLNLVRAASGPLFGEQLISPLHVGFKSVFSQSPEMGRQVGKKWVWECISGSKCAKTNVQSQF